MGTAAGTCAAADVYLELGQIHLYQGGWPRRADVYYRTGRTLLYDSGRGRLGEAFSNDLLNVKLLSHAATIQRQVRVRWSARRQFVDVGHAHPSEGGLPNFEIFETALYGCQTRKVQRVLVSWFSKLKCAQ